jgi:hypothetical protein
VPAPAAHRYRHRAVVADQEETARWLELARCDRRPVLSAVPPDVFCLQLVDQPSRVGAVIGVRTISRCAAALSVPGLWTRMPSTLGHHEQPAGR